MKRIIITEEEKNRILEMHKSAILLEQQGTAAPATPTTNIMAQSRQQQRDAVSQARQQGREFRQDMRQAKRDIRQDARQAARDERQGARDARQAERQQQFAANREQQIKDRQARQEKFLESQKAKELERERARTQRQAERAARKEARQEKRDMKQLQAEIADFQKVLQQLIQANTNINNEMKQNEAEGKANENTLLKQKLDTYTPLITTYQTAIANLQANLQSMGSGTQYQDDSFKTN